MEKWVKRGCLGAAVLLWMTFYQPAYADQETAVVTAPAAELKVFNRSILTFRATLLGETPKVRMQRAEAVINEMIGGTEDLDIRIDAIQDSYLVLLGERRAFIVTPKDTDADISVADAATEAAKRLETVVTESQQARSVRFLLVAGGFSVVATLLYLALLRLADVQ